MTPALEAHVAAWLGAGVSEAVRGVAQRLAAGSDSALAVLFYGSNLRTGALDGVLDFYVLTSGPAERGLWPRVSYHEWPDEGGTLRAKVATMTLARFADAARGRRLDTTIWTRFVQPSALVWAHDAASQADVASAVAQAATTAARLAAVLGPRRGPAADFWTALFTATYAAEFRVEVQSRSDSIIAANAVHFETLLPLAWSAGGIAFVHERAGFTPQLKAAERRRVRRWWRIRRRGGKPLNFARLLRAAATFEGAARYAAWKIERHSGMAVTLTAWQEHHPVLAAPAVLWSLWRHRRAEARRRRAQG